MLRGLSLALSSALVGSSPTPETSPDSDRQRRVETTRGERARLEFGPSATRSIEVLDLRGRPVATVRLRPEASVELSLPPGSYTLRSLEGSTQDLELRGGVVTRVDIEGAGKPERPRPGGRDATVEPSPASPEAAGRSKATEAESRPPAVARDVGWRRWGSPLLSALVPGLGQGINGEPGKGVGIFAGGVGLGLGALFAWRADEEAAGAGFDDSGRSAALEIVRLSAVAGLSTGFLLLWAGQIMDAYRAAVDAEVTPRRDHRLELQLARFFSVGASPGEPAYALYDQVSVALMGQVLPRLSVGVGDLGFRVSRGLRQRSVQAGPRASYRFFELRTLWLGAAAGFVLQGTTMKTETPSVDPQSDETTLERRFGSSVYAQAELRWFLLDRWSLELMPRVSWSLTARDFGPGRQIPRYATTFELGAGVGVYF